MSFIDCVLQAVSDGKITKQSAEYIQSNFTGENQAEVVGKLRDNLKRDKYLKALQAVKEGELENIVLSKPDSARNLMSLLTKDISNAAGYSNIEYRARAVQGVFDSEFGEAMEAMRSKYVGLSSDNQLNDDVVRALYGETVSADATKFAKDWNNVSEHARTWFNKSGGDVAKLEDWRLPQGHNIRKLRKAGFDNWYKNIKDKIDVEKTMKQSYEAKLAEILPDLEKQAVRIARAEAKEVGKKFTPKMRQDAISNAKNLFAKKSEKEALKEVYDTITSQGLNKLEPGKIPQGMTSNIAQKKQDHRFIKFKDADSYLEYQKTFGNPDVFASMSDHLRGMSQDIAKLEILGPNPDKTYQKLKDVVRKQNGGQGLGANKERFLDSVYNVATGLVDSSDIITDGDFVFSAVMGGFRAINTSAKLGSAVLSSVSDLGTGMVTAGYNKMSYRKILGRQIGMLLDEMTTRGSAEDIKFGVRLGLIADAWNSTLANSRFAESGTGKLQAVTETVLRASGINAYTEAGRKAFGMEFASNMAESFGKNFDDLNLSDTFKRYGFTKEDWDIIKTSKPLEYKGNKFFDIQDLMKKDQPLALRVMEMIQQETDYAVLIPDARVRAITTAGAQKGTIKGELARTATQFKSFPITFMTAHIGRILGMSKGDGLAYGAKLFVATTVLGSLAIEMKDFTKGKTSRYEGLDEDNAGKFAMDSILQGGGLGIFGDFFFQDQSRYGNSAITTLAGPLGTLTEDVYNITAGNAHKLARGDNTHIGSDIVNMGKNYLPAQNLWYTRLLFDRLVFDNIKSAVDPKYASKVRKQKRRMEKDTGQDWRVDPSTF